VIVVNMQLVWNSLWIILKSLRLINMKKDNVITIILKERCVKDIRIRNGYVNVGQ
jgi:hypothetical protein